MMVEMTEFTRPVFWPSCYARLLPMLGHGSAIFS
jgi:hypothetical protein